MRILFDGWIFYFQKAGGINRYFAEIISRLPADWQPTVSGTDDFGENVPIHRQLRTSNPPRFRPARLQRRVRRHWWTPRLARRTELLHPTYYELTNGLRLSDFKCPVVATVYDMIYARFPKQFDHAEATLRRQRESVLRADRIVCISHSTERDLLEFVPEAAGKTTVVHLASSFPVQASHADEDVFAEPTFLYVGGRVGYKNFLFLLRAFARAASVAPNIRLTVAGAPLVPEERWQLYFLGIADRVQSVVFPDEQALEGLYRKSVALLYPSLCEGFGIPPLEAMSCGTALVTANTTSLPEVLGEAGIMLDPTDQDAWTDCILKLARTTRERAACIERGRTRARQFSWMECARRHLEIYQRLG